MMYVLCCCLYAVYNVLTAPEGTYLCVFVRACVCMCVRACVYVQGRICMCVWWYRCTSLSSAVYYYQFFCANIHTPSHVYVVRLLRLEEAPSTDKDAQVQCGPIERACYPTSASSAFH